MGSTVFMRTLAAMQGGVLKIMESIMNNEQRHKEDELYDLRSFVIDSAPQHFSRLLRGYDHPMETFDDLRTWEHKASHEIMEAATYDDSGRAPCPLCKELASSWYNETGTGWTAEGLSRHLLGSHSSMQCFILQTAH